MKDWVSDKKIENSLSLSLSSLSCATVENRGKGRLSGDCLSGGDFAGSPRPPAAARAREVDGSRGVAVRCTYLL
jgi:hypothetical protein